MINKIRNFAIIAHIDHGKSTISDRMIEMYGGIETREMQEQILDSMDIERERGITIKSQTARLKYEYNGEEYILNLMDTPGHVDFSYEVSRCLAACEGAILVVDATQGVEAQTLVNAYKAIDANLEIIIALNKVDLQSADIESCKRQIEEVIGLDPQNSISVSGKTGFGINNILNEIVEIIPPPKGDISATLKALLVDASYDIYIGVVMLVRVIDGSIKVGDIIKTLSNTNSYKVERVGIYSPKKIETEMLSAGEVGFVCVNIKKIDDCNIGDTIVLKSDEETKLLQGFKQVRPSVFSGIYPVAGEDYHLLKDAISKLRLNDASITYEYETSQALGSGFRCGFLGLLHMEVSQERLEREFNIDIIVTAPSVVYKILLNNQTELIIHNPEDLPDPVLIKSIYEPIAKVSIVLPDKYIGDVMNLCIKKRGVQTETKTGGSGRVTLIYKMPIGEIVTDFHDKLKSISSGYASFEWEADGYEESDIVKVGILINGEIVDAISLLTHRSKSEQRGRAICIKLKEVIPRQMFVVPIQAAIGGKIIARETISAMRKDVTSKCYGGDISRKKKLLEKQKKGKKKMKMLGSVEVPQSAFLAVLKTDE